MEIEFICEHCDDRQIARFPSDDKNGDARACSACGQRIPMHAVERMNRGEPVMTCAICDCPKLYVQRDFNRNFGLLIVGVTVVISGVVLMLTHSTLWAMAVLMVVTLFDAFVYNRLPGVTVCYRCETVHRGFPKNPEHDAFDIHVAEEFAYGQE